MKFYTADTHFSQSHIMTYEKRPFKSVEEMNEEIIKRWNSVVTDSDIVYHLGDFGSGRPSQLSHIAKQLKGEIVLIRGNIDKKVIVGEAKYRFRSTMDYLTVQDGEHYVILFHYPILKWTRKHYGAIHLYGHIHSGKLPDIGNAINVGTDVWNYYPVTLNQILQKFPLRTYTLQDVRREYENWD